MDDASKLEGITEEDMKPLEEFVSCMKLMHQCTFALCSESRPTASLVLPLLAKLETAFTAQNQDSPFMKGVKKAVWSNLSTRYKVSH